MSNSSIDPSLRQQGDSASKRSPKSAGVSLESGYGGAQNGPYPHRPTSAGMSEIAQQLAHAVEHHPSGEYSHQGAMGPPSAQYAQYAHDLSHGSMQMSPGAEGSDKKKLKTTRACDECRRKKIKCDGDTDTPGDQCANCLRTNSECLYTKPAQKRGPSRGYIRELSDRVASLEEKGIGLSPMTPHQASPFFTPDATEMRGYKRTHSMSENPGSATTPTVAPFARMAGGDTVRVQFELNTPVTKPLTEAERTQLNGWMHIAQARFALLPDKIDDAEHLLNECPDTLREAFVKTLRAALSLSDSPDRALYREAYSTALGLVHKPKAASAPANVVHLQVCVLLVFLSNTAGPETQQSSPDPDGHVFLAKALTIADHLQLHAPSTSDASDALAALVRSTGRRAYGYLQLIAMWTALAHGELPSAPRDHFRLQPADGHAIAFDAFLLMCMLPDLGLLRTHAQRSEPVPPPAARLDEYLDAVQLGLGMAGGRDPSEELVVPLARSAVTIYRFLVHAHDFKARMTPAIVAEAANVVTRFQSADLTFFPIAHQTLGLALLVLALAAEDSTTHAAAIAALEQAKEALSKGTLREDAWRTPLTAKVEAALKTKAAKNTEHVADFGQWVREGYMHFFG